MSTCRQAVSSGKIEGAHESWCSRSNATGSSRAFCSLPNAVPPAQSLPPYAEPSSDEVRRGGDLLNKACRWPTGSPGCPKRLARDLREERERTRPPMPAPTTPMDICPASRALGRSVAAMSAVADIRREQASLRQRLNAASWTPVSESARPLPLLPSPGRGGSNVPARVAAF